MITLSELWDESLAFANANRSSEFLRRTAAGRLFYAAFHDVADAIGYPSQGEGSHDKLVKEAKASKDKLIRRLAGKLDELRLKRQVADYRLTVDFAEVELEELCTKARLVRGLLDERRASLKPPSGPGSPKSGPSRSAPSITI